MPIVRRKLDENTVYPSNLRYNPDTDTVQSLVNGSWVDNPDADPRTQTTLPARITSDPACDAAQSVVDALHGQIDSILEAIDNASTLFTIAGIILSIFTFGAFAIFISLALGIADQMVGFGSAAIEAALTEPVYDTLKCILFCHFTSGGRLEEGGLDAVMADVTDQIGGIGATILNAMLALAGVGGVNNLAALGQSTGDCAACECGCGDEEIGFSLVLFFGTEIERSGCNIKAAGDNDGGHDAVTVTWDGTHPWQLDREGLISGDTGTSTWQYYTWDGSEHGPFTSGTAPLDVTVTTIELFGTAGHTFSVSWDVKTPPP